MRDEEEQMVALAPVAEPTAEPTAEELPELDWREFQRRMWEIQDWLRETVKPMLDDIAPALQSICDAVYPTGPYSTHTRNRQRIAAARERARIVTRAKGDKARRRHQKTAA